MAWFDRVSSSASIDALPERISPRDLSALHQAIQCQLLPGQWGRFWGKDSFQYAPTVWTLCAAAPTFDEVLSSGARLSLLDSSAFIFSLQKRLETVSVTIYPIVALAEWQHLMLVQQLALGFPRLVGNQNLVRSVVLSGRPQTIKQLAACEPSACRELIGASEVVFDRAILELKNPAASESWEVITRSVIEPLMGLRLKQQSATYRVIKVLIDHCAAGVPLDMVSVAVALHTEKSTLRRRLKAEGQSFSRLLAQFRVQEAGLRLLKDDDLAQISRSLGYQSVISLRRLLKDVRKVAE
ncbi:MAG: hypothetical protein K0U58_00105 [Gammaproteobacteria bacterium]|nr:hypothetical protein [Gammaproteobacteria bacterium]